MKSQPKVPVSYRAFVRLTTEDFYRVFTPRFRLPSEAESYAEHKVDFWPTAEDYGIFEAQDAPTATWKNGRLRPLTKKEKKSSVGTSTTNWYVL